MPGLSKDHENVAREGTRVRDPAKRQRYVGSVKDPFNSKTAPNEKSSNSEKFSGVR